MVPPAVFCSVAAWAEQHGTAFRRVEIPGARSVENIVQLAPAVYLVSTRNFAVYYYADTGKVGNFSLDGVPVADGAEYGQLSP